MKEIAERGRIDQNLGRFIAKNVLGWDSLGEISVIFNLYCMLYDISDILLVNNQHGVHFRAYQLIRF